MKIVKYENALVLPDFERNAYLLHLQFPSYPCYGCGKMRTCSHECKPFREWRQASWNESISALRR